MELSGSFSKKEGHKFTTLRSGVITYAFMPGWQIFKVSWHENENSVPCSRSCRVLTYFLTSLSRENLLTTSRYLWLCIAPRGLPKNARNAASGKPVNELYNPKKVSMKNADGKYHRVGPTRMQHPPNPQSRCQPG